MLLERGYKGGYVSIETAKLAAFPLNFIEPVIVHGLDEAGKAGLNS